MMRCTFCLSRMTNKWHHRVCVLCYEQRAAAWNVRQSDSRYLAHPSSLFRSHGSHKTTQHTHYQNSNACILIFVCNLCNCPRKHYVLERANIARKSACASCGNRWMSESRSVPVGWLLNKCDHEIIIICRHFGHHTQPPRNTIKSLLGAAKRIL